MVAAILGTGLTFFSIAAGSEEVALDARAGAAGPYCGVYSLFAALSACGINTNFEQLLEQKYVGSIRGSSALELQSAARDLGAVCSAASGLSATTLRTAQCPLIL